METAGMQSRLSHETGGHVDEMGPRAHPLEDWLVSLSVTCHGQSRWAGGSELRVQPLPREDWGGPLGTHLEPCLLSLAPQPSQVLTAGRELEVAILVDVTRAPLAPAALFDHTSCTSLLNS